MMIVVLKHHCKVNIGDKETGEVIGIEKIDSKFINAIKRNLAFRKSNPENLFIVSADDEKIKEYFQSYIEKLKFKKRPEKFVGICNKRLEEICYREDSVIPLHLCQSLSINIFNMRSAIRNNDEEFKKELYDERKQIYKDAKTLFNIDMTYLNHLTWEEYKHTITNYKFLEFKKYVHECEECECKFENYAKKDLLCDACLDEYFDEI